MTNLFFTGTGGKSWERLLREQERGYELRSVQEEVHDTCDQSVPYVFPACGHVFGYSKELIGRCCPLCRQKGPYVALQFPFQPNICGDMPTHVFSPCGHAASSSACAEWSRLQMPIVTDAIYHTAPICPFCAVKLDTDSKGEGICKKLIISFEYPEEPFSPSPRNVTEESDVATTATDSAPSALKKPKMHLRNKIKNLFKQK